MRAIRYKRLIVGSVATLLLGISTLIGLNQSPAAQAQAVFQSGDSISQSSPTKGSYFGAGSTVQVTDNVDGDVYAGGQTITITGDVSGDIIAAGQTVTISGNVSGDIRVMAQTLTITGEVTGNVSSLAQTLAITNAATIGRDVAFASQSVSIDGSVGRDISGVVEKLTVTGDVGRDIHYVSKETINQSATASIGGEVSQTVVKDGQPAQPSKLSSLAFALLVVGLTVLVISLVIPRWVRSSTDAMSEQPWKVVIAGLTTLLIPGLIILLLVSIVGSLLALTLLLSYGLLLILSIVFASYFTGRLIFRDTQPVALQSIAGAVIYVILLFIPFVGFIAWIAGSIIGAGIVMLDISRRIASQATQKETSQSDKKDTIEKKSKKAKSDK